MLKRLNDCLVIAALVGLPAFALAANKLEHHPSPYLAMHAGDPVNWQLWDEELFAQARQQNKLIMVSVGYFSCNWCHVMQRESYQDKAVADTLNGFFLSVKIDRELRPELDRRLIDFVERVRGAAGWPLHVFLTPQGYPVTGFTYLPKNEFHEVVLQLQQQWLTQQGEIKKAAEQFHIAALTEGSSKPLLEKLDLTADSLASAFVDQAMQVADELQGGFGDTSKFPQNPQLLSLLQLVKQGLNDKPELVDFIHLTLREMASRHLMDHVNGGFFRYTTDPDWQTPHYEKMLYDNAQMVLLYLQAEQLWPDRGYGEVAETTLAFMQKQMKHPQGGYVSSLSAVDVDDEEGSAYLWQREELEKIIGKEDYSYVSGQWQIADSEFLLKPLTGLGAEGDIIRKQRIRTQLQSVQRTIMPIDDKRLASWNALVLQALVAAAHYDRKYLADADEQYQFMNRAFLNQDQLIRFAANQAQAESTFEDYAFVASAFQQFGELKSDQRAIEQARSLVLNAYRRFYFEGKWKASEQSLMPRSAGQWLIQDNVIPSPLTQWLSIVLKLPESDTVLRVEALDMLRRVTSSLIDTPYYYGTLVALRHRQAR